MAPTFNFLIGRFTKLKIVVWKNVLLFIDCFELWKGVPTNLRDWRKDRNVLG